MVFCSFYMLHNDQNKHRYHKPGKVKAASVSKVLLAKLWFYPVFNIVCVISSISKIERVCVSTTDLVRCAWKIHIKKVIDKRKHGQLRCRINKVRDLEWIFENNPFGCVNHLVDFITKVCQSVESWVGYGSAYLLFFIGQKRLIEFGWVLS